MKGTTYRKTEQALGTGDDEGLAEVAFHLAAKEVEVLCGRRREGDVHVHVCGAVVHLVWVIGELPEGHCQCTAAWKRRPGVRTCSMRSILDEECSGPAPSRLDNNSG